VTNTSPGSQAAPMTPEGEGLDLDEWESTQKKLEKLASSTCLVSDPDQVWPTQKQLALHGLGTGNTVQREETVLS
jgi:hypothetical protein